MYHGKNETKNREREREKKKINNLEGIVQSYNLWKRKKWKKKKKEIINGAFNAFPRECTTRLTRTRAAWKLCRDIKKKIEAARGGIRVRQVGSLQKKKESKEQIYNSAMRDK